MKTNFNLLFYLKKQKAYVSGTMPVYMRITVNGKRSEVSAGRDCEPSGWNNHSGRGIGTKSEVRVEIPGPLTTSFRVCIKWIP
ncbi:hypothetical protein BH09BAC6_BH09BAC6_19110 [soil metagenome]